MLMLYAIIIKFIDPEGKPIITKKNKRSRAYDSIAFEWKPVRKDLANGEILGYIIKYQLLVSGQEEREEEPIQEIQVKETTAKLVNLERFSTYQIKISAFNKIGRGPELVIQRGTH